MNSFTEGAERDKPQNGHLVPDFLQANDWKIGQFLVLILTLQVIVLLLIFLDGYGLVPLYIRGLATFLFYSYVPGLVLLRVLRMHHLGGAMTTLLSVAASVVISMLTGLVLNLLYMGLSGPLPFTLTTVTIGQTITLLILLALAFLIDRRYASEPRMDVSPFMTAPAFALYSLPLVAVLATYLLNGWNFAWLQIILLLIIAAAVLALLIVRVPSQLYPVAVVCIALAVLLHTSLVSRFVVEWADISFEYWSANRTLLNGFWTMTSGGRTDSVLSVTILAPMYVLLSGLDLNLVFKVCYPTLLTFIPLGVFCMARDRLGSRGALLAAFLIISGTVFFTEFLGLARQIVAELLLVAVAALLLHRFDVSVNRMILAWIMAIGMIVSHYGLVAVVIPGAIISAILYLLLERRHVSRAVAAKVVGSAALLLVPPVLWYGNVSGSTVLTGIKKHFEQLINGSGSVELINDLIPMLLFQRSISFQSWLVMASTVLVCALSLYGLYRLAVSSRRVDSGDRAYLAVAAPFIAFTFLAFIDIDLFDFISRERFLHICLLFTAPLVVFGGICAFRALNNFRPLKRMKKPSLAALGSILVIIFLANAGVMSFAAGVPSHIELDMNIKDVPRHSDGAYLAANFTVGKGSGAGSIYADANRAYLLDMLGGRYDPLYGRETASIHGGTNNHYFLSSENLEGMLWLENPDRSRLNKTYVPMGEEFSDNLHTMDKVYTSQEAELYYKKF